MARPDAPAPAVPTSSGSQFRAVDYHYCLFDLDHTIVRYNLVEFLPFLYDVLRKSLVQLCKYPAEVLQEPYEFTYGQKGLLVDWAHGNLVKLDRRRRPTKAMHGTRPLSKEELRRLYGAGALHFEGPRTDHLLPLTTYFEMPLACLWARLVDWDDRTGRRDYARHGKAFETAFEHNFMDFCRGWYFSDFRPERFLFKMDSTKAWLEALRNEHGVRVMLVTNSFAEYTHLLMDHAYGGDWRRLFDLVIVCARKPLFFTDTNTPFHACVHGPAPEYRKRSDVPVDELRLGAGDGSPVYRQGNFGVLLAHLRRWHADDAVRVCYFGDHLHSDIDVPRNATTIDTVAIIEELDEHRDSTHLWGSFFFDTVEEEGGTRCDTFWSHLAQRSATLSVPSLDYLAKFPASHVFCCGSSCQ